MTPTFMHKKMGIQDQINFIIKKFDFEKALLLIKKVHKKDTQHLSITDLKQEARKCLDEAVELKDVSDGIYGIQAECYVDDNGKIFLELRYIPILANTLSKVLKTQNHVKPRQD